MSKKRIKVIAHFCDYGKENTNNRFNYIAKILAEAGHDVELITSSFSHRDKRQRESAEDTLPYRITLIHEPSYQKNVSLKRLFVSHKKMARNLKQYLDSCDDDTDLIYCACPSLDVAAVAADFSKKRGIKFAVDVQDLWPEAFSLAFKIPLISDAIFLPMRFKANRVYKSADRIFAVSQTYMERALAASRADTPACVVYLGTDLAQFDKSAWSATRKNHPDELWLGYCGTLGASYDLNLVTDALAIMKDRGLKPPRLIVLGDGPKAEKFEKYALGAGIEASFMGRLPYSEMCSVLAACDMAVNPIKGRAMQSIINKHADYAAAGLAVINTQSSEEYCSLLEKYGCGLSCDSDNAEALALLIERLCRDAEERVRLGAASRKMAEELFDRTFTYREILNYAEQ